MIGEFLEDRRGYKSSKRLGYIIALTIVFYKFIDLLDKLVDAGAYNEASNVFMYGGIGMLVMGGFVTAEIFSKIKK